MCGELQEYKDVESGWEIPDQEFIWKVYLVIAIQLLLTIIIAYVVMIPIHHLAYFLRRTSTGLLIYLIATIMMITAFCLLDYSPFANYFLVGVLTTVTGFLVGLTCAATSGKVNHESVMVTIAMVVNLTVFSFWGASKGYDFELLMPFLFGAVVSITLFVSVHMIFFPMGKIFEMIYWCLGSITFCGQIVCVTNSLITKNWSHNKYICAAAFLYVEFINLFLSIFIVVEALHC